MPTTELRFSPAAPAFDEVDQLIVCGTRARLGAPDTVDALPEGARAVWRVMVSTLRARDGVAITSTWVPAEPRAKKIIAVALSDRASRHNSPGRPELLAAALNGRLNKGVTGVLVALTSKVDAFAAGCAIGRAASTFSDRSAKLARAAQPRAHVGLVAPDGAVEDVARIDAAVEGIRLAAHLVDMPASVLTTTAFVARAEAVAEELGVDCRVLRADVLEERGFGGLLGVGRAAEHPPALVHLCYRPDGAQERLAWVGKGIVYDTGGLSIKTKTGMPGMKRDVGGAAAVLGAFSAAVKLGYPQRIDALLCLAENSVGPGATRPDDILHMYSGKTVEVNNTDAEGRLVMADGVAYAVKHLKPTLVLDIATLTGAQLMATGKLHAAVITNDEELEQIAVKAGRRSGDLVHPLPFAPELFRREFKSKVADLKNSVNNRMNAQPSCAAQFVAEHLVGYAGPWVHLDIAGPSEREERGTGYGVALLLEMFQLFQSSRA